MNAKSVNDRRVNTKHNSNNTHYCEKRNSTTYISTFSTFPSGSAHNICVQLYINATCKCDTNMNPALYNGTCSLTKFYIVLNFLFVVFYWSF